MASSGITSSSTLRSQEQLPSSASPSTTLHLDVFRDARFRMDAIVGHKSSVYGSVKTGVVCNGLVPADVSGQNILQFQNTSLASTRGRVVVLRCLSDVDLTYPDRDAAKATQQSGLAGNLKNAHHRFLQGVQQKLENNARYQAIELVAPRNGVVVLKCVEEIAGLRDTATGVVVAAAPPAVNLQQLELTTTTSNKYKEPVTVLLSIEITVNNSLAVANSILLQQYMTCPHAKMLALCVKSWAKQQGLVRDATLWADGVSSCFAYTLMTVSFLQSVQLLPILQWVDDECHWGWSVGDRWDWAALSCDDPYVRNLEFRKSKGSCEWKIISMQDMVKTSSSDAWKELMESSSLGQLDTLAARTTLFPDYLELQFFEFLRKRIHEQRGVPTVMSVRHPFAPDPRAGLGMCAVAVEDPYMTEADGSHRILRCNDSFRFDLLCNKIFDREARLRMKFQESVTNLVSGHCVILAAGAPAPGGAGASSTTCHGTSTSCSFAFSSPQKQNKLAAQHPQLSDSPASDASSTSVGSGRPDAFSCPPSPDVDQGPGGPEDHDHHPCHEPDEQSDEPPQPDKHQDQVDQLGKGNTQVEDQKKLSLMAPSHSPQEEMVVGLEGRAALRPPASAAERSSPEDAKIVAVVQPRGGHTSVFACPLRPAARKCAAAVHSAFLGCAARWSMMRLVPPTLVRGRRAGTGGLIFSKEEGAKNENKAKPPATLPARASASWSTSCTSPASTAGGLEDARTTSTIGATKQQQQARGQNKRMANAKGSTSSKKTSAQKRKSSQQIEKPQPQEQNGFAGTHYTGLRRWRKWIHRCRERRDGVWTRRQLQQLLPVVQVVVATIFVIVAIEKMLVAWCGNDEHCRNWVGPPHLLSPYLDRMSSYFNRTSTTDHRRVRSKNKKIEEKKKLQLQVQRQGQGPPSEPACPPSHHFVPVVSPQEPPVCSTPAPGGGTKKKAAPEPQASRPPMPSGRAPGETKKQKGKAAPEAVHLSDRPVPSSEQSHFCPGPAPGDTKKQKSKAAPEPMCLSGRPVPSGEQSHLCPGPGETKNKKKSKAAPEPMCLSDRPVPVCSEQSQFCSGPSETKKKKSKAAPPEPVCHSDRPAPACSDQSQFCSGPSETKKKKDNANAAAEAPTCNLVPISSSPPSPPSPASQSCSASAGTKIKKKKKSKKTEALPSSSGPQNQNIIIENNEISNTPPAPAEKHKEKGDVNDKENKQIEKKTKKKKKRKKAKTRTSETEDDDESEDDSTGMRLFHVASSGGFEEEFVVEVQTGPTPTTPEQPPSARPSKPSKDACASTTGPSSPNPHASRGVCPAVPR